MKRFILKLLCCLLPIIVTLPSFAADKQQAAFSKLQQQLRHKEAMAQYGAMVDAYSSAIVKHKWQPNYLAKLYLGRGIAKHKQNNLNSALADLATAEEHIAVFGSELLLLAEVKTDIYQQQKLGAHAISELLRLYDKYQEPPQLAKIIGDYFLHRANDTSAAILYYQRAAKHGELGTAFIMSFNKSASQIMAIYQPLIDRASAKDAMRIRKEMADSLMRELSSQNQAQSLSLNKIFSSIIADCKNRQQLVFVCRQNNIESEVAAYLAANLLKLGQLKQAEQVIGKYFPSQDQLKWMHYVALAMGQARQGENMPQSLYIVDRALRRNLPVSRELKNVSQQYGYSQLALLQHALAEQIGNAKLAKESLQLAINWANAWQLVSLYSMQAVQFKSDGDFLKAKQQLLMALQHSNQALEKANLYAHLADIYYLEGNLKQSLSSLRKAAELAPLAAELWASMAVMERELGNLQQYQKICGGEFANSIVMQNVCAKNNLKTTPDLPKYRSGAP